MRVAVMGIVLAAMAVPAAPALADPPPWAKAHGKRHKHKDKHDRHHEARAWRGDDGRYHCRRPDGTTGLVVGGVAGALLGRAVDGGRDRTVGTIVGAGAGALLGREIDRGDRCR